MSNQLSLPPLDKPNTLQTFREGYIRLVQQSSNIATYLVLEVDTEEILVLERKDTVITGKNVFGDLIFKAVGKWDDPTGTIQLANGQGRSIGFVYDGNTISDKSCANDNELHITANWYKVEDKPSYYYNIHPEDDENNQAGYISINSEGDVVVAVTDDDQTTTTSALIMLRAIQLINSRHSGVKVATVSPLEKVSPTLTKTQRLGCLEDVNKMWLQNLGSARTNGNYFRLTSADNKVALIFELDCCVGGRAVLRNIYGIEQCCATNINTAIGIEVKLHEKYVIGRLTLDSIKSDTGCTHWTVKPMDKESSSYEIKSDDGVEVGKIFEEERRCTKGLGICMNSTISSHQKSLILFYALKRAIETKLQVSPSICVTSPGYRSFESDGKDRPSNLLVLEKLSVVTIMKVGQASNSGRNYYEVVDIAHSNGTCLVFEAVQRPLQIDVVAKDTQGKLQFSAFGVWDMKKEMDVYLNSGELLGITRNKSFFEGTETVMNGNIILETPKQTTKEDEAEVERLSVYQIGDKNGVVLAQIRRCGDEARILFVDQDEIMTASPKYLKRKAVILCYALKVALNKYNIYCEQTANLEYEYEK